MPDDELKLKEPHPGGYIAKEWLSENIGKMPHLEESLASSALAGNRMANVCLGTLKRIKNGEIISDRYMMGLAWCVFSLIKTQAENEPIRHKKT